MKLSEQETQAFLRSTTFTYFIIYKHNSHVNFNAKNISYGENAIQFMA